MHFLAYHPSIPGFGTQPTLRRAAIAAGWEIQGTGILTHIMAAKLTLVNDFVAYYADEDEIPDHVGTGPIFAGTDDSSSSGSGTKKQENDDLDPELRRIFDPKNPNKVFLAMGSSGHKNQLVSAIRAVNSEEYHTVALVPPTICTKDEVVEALGGTDNLSSTLHLTDQFIPSKIVNAMADVAIIHGGQGTVQTAMLSGTPIVGVPFGADQDHNLMAVERQGAGVKILFSKWDTESVSRALKQIIDDKAFHKAAQKIREENIGCDGAKVSAESIFKFVKDQSIFAC
jgi:UDP-N-acetylglucosamine:LPS N-acetylglucosamine transferase